MHVPPLLRLALAMLLMVVAACGGEAPEVAVEVADPDPTPAVIADDDSSIPDEASVTDVLSMVDDESNEPVELEPELPDPWTVTVATANDDVEWVDTRQSPDGDPANIEWGVWNPTPFGTTLAMVVVEGDADDEWVEVMVPVKPNGSTAWVMAEQFTFSQHRYRAEVDLAAHQVTVWNGDEVVVQTEAVIGAASTPTPVGRFYVNDLVEGDGASYGPWILSLSAFSETLESFAGGEPVIAIHGTNQPELIGQSRSNGCIRIPNDVVQLLADTVPLGTPVDIVH